MSKVVAKFAPREYVSKLGTTPNGRPIGGTAYRRIDGEALDASFAAWLDGVIAECGEAVPDGANVYVTYDARSASISVQWKAPQPASAGNVKAPASELDAIIRQWADYKANGGPEPIPESIAKQVARLMKPAAPPQMRAAAPPPPANAVPTTAPRQMRQRRKAANDYDGR